MAIDKIRDAQFVLIFEGECPIAEVCNGWDALLQRISTEYTVDPTEHAELVERLQDEDGWTYDTCRSECLPWSYSEDTGEIGRMMIYRIGK